MTSAIIIGGGIAGCSTAFALAKRGIHVTLVERHQKLASEGSGNPIAALYPKLSRKPNLADQLALAGFAFTLDLLHQMSPEIYHQCGLLQLAHHSRELEKLKAISDLTEYQSVIQSVSKAQASEIAGIPLNYGGLFLPAAGWLKPQSFCEALTTHANINVIFNQSALSISKVHAQWHVQFAYQETLSADIVVICNANDLTQFTQISSAKITPVRGQINFTKQNTVSEAIRCMICTDHFISPAVDGWHTLGTTYAPNDNHAELKLEDTKQIMKAIRQINDDVFLSFDATPLNGRVGWRSSTLDYMPLAGKLIDEIALRARPPRASGKPEDLPWHDGLFVNAGHGSKGMITAPICGELIAALAATGRPNLSVALASKMNPSRFLLKDLSLKTLAQTLYR